MSNANSREWIEALVFGSDGSPPPCPPEFKSWTVRLARRGIDVAGTVANGGLAQIQYVIAGDLDRLCDYFESMDSQPTFRTGLVTRVFNHLIVHGRGKKETLSATEGDREVLKSILDGDDGDGPRNYESAQFWGELARRLLNERRSVTQAEVMKPEPPEDFTRNVIRLYDVTCKSLGRWMDPLDMKLVPRTDWIDPARFADAKTLEAFALIDPDHIVSRTLREFVTRNVVDRILDGERIPFHHSTLEIFVENVAAVDRRIRRVDGSERPPVLVDAFQRLVATCGLDHLWTTVVTGGESATSSDSIVVWELSNRLNLLERQNDYLLSRLKAAGGR